MRKTWNEPNFDILPRDLFSHWIDWLSFTIRNYSEIDQLLNWRTLTLDNDNASDNIITLADENFTIKKSKTPNGTGYYFHTTYQTISVPCFVIIINSKDQIQFTGTYWIIHFYGAYFRIKDLDYFSDSFLSFIDSITSDLYFARIDYRFDFISKEYYPELPNENTIFPNLRKNRKGQNWKNPKTWIVESWQIGNKKYKNVFIRLYNKKVELEKNLKKMYLYGDMQEYKSYFRLEFECGSKFCSMLKWKDLEILINKVFAYTGFDNTKYLWNIYKPVICLDLSDTIQKSRYIKIFLSMWKTLKQNGIDPILILTDNI